MPVYNPEIHHRQSIRLKGYDYSLPNYYFVTICVKNRGCLFGEIKNGRMVFSEIGRAAMSCWREIPKHFTNVNLNTFCVMPNHIHGIIEILDIDNVGTQNVASLQKYKNKFGPQSKNLSSIIRRFKIGVKKYAVINDLIFAWQPRFYEHIIRNEKSFENITNYIINNPFNWQQDIENSIYFKNAKKDDFINYYKHICNIKKIIYAK